MFWVLELLLKTTEIFRCINKPIHSHASSKNKKFLEERQLSLKYFNVYGAANRKYKLTINGP